MEALYLCRRGVASGVWLVCILFELRHVSHHRCPPCAVMAGINLLKGYLLTCQRSLDIRFDLLIRFCPDQIANLAADNLAAGATEPTFIRRVDKTVALLGVHIGDQPWCSIGDQAQLGGACP